MFTLITPAVSSALNLVQIDESPISGVGGKVEKAPVVVVDMILPGGIKIPSWRVAVSDLRGVDMLIGMDIIQLGDFSISTLNHETVFTFAIPPFQNRTDLYEKAEAVNKRNK
jgi:hypothetical protein